MKRKLKLKIKIKRSSHNVIENEKNKESVIKDKLLETKETDKKVLILDNDKKEQKSSNKKVEKNESNILIEKKDINENKNLLNDSKIIDNLEKDVNKTGINQIQKNVIYAEPTSIPLSSTIAQKTPVKKSLSISKGRKGKKSSLWNGKKKVKKLKKPPKKVDLMEALNKVLKSIKMKDVYGFFLIPVDTKIVTDYASIIKNPMDFGTMQKKIDTKQYTKISEFQHDFELVIQNAKTYNAPETIYYRSADKISKFGSRLIEREITAIKNVEEKRRLYFQEIRRASKANSVTATTTPRNIPEKNNAVTSTSTNTLPNTSVPNKIENTGTSQTKKKKS